MKKNILLITIAVIIIAITSHAQVKPKSEIKLNKNTESTLSSDKFIGKWKNKQASGYKITFDKSRKEFLITTIFTKEDEQNMTPAQFDRLSSGWTGKVINGVLIGKSFEGSGLDEEINIQLKSETQIIINKSVYTKVKK